MAITGISSIDNKQIIAAGALSAISANQALITSGGDSLQGLYDTVSTNSASWTGGGGSYPRNITADSILLSAEVTPGDSDLARVDISPYDIVFSHPEQGYGTVDATTIQNWDSTYETVSTNSASWTGGGASYTSPSGSIWISGNNIESTDSAYIPSHTEDVLLTAISSWSSTNGYATLANTNKVYFIAQGRASAFDNEGTFLNSSYNSTVSAETEYPPIKLYTTTWVSVKYSAYSAGIMDAYTVELARKNEVNSALNRKLDSSAFTGYYPSNNPSGFAKASDAVMTSSFNLYDGRIAGINNQYFIGCDSAYNCTLMGTSASTGTKTASAYVGTGHQGVTIQISARNTGTLYINWTAFGEDASNLSAGQMSYNATPINKISAFSFNSPIAENISGVKLYGNNVNFTAYSAYTSDVKQLARQDNITFLSGAVDYVSANAGGEFPQSATEAIDVVTANSAAWEGVTGKQDELTFAYDNVNAISSINNSAIRYPSSAQLLPYPIEFVATTGDATGQNILYVVTGSN